MYLLLQVQTRGVPYLTRSRPLPQHQSRRGQQQGDTADDEQAFSHGDLPQGVQESDGSA